MIMVAIIYHLATAGDMNQTSEAKGAEVGIRIGARVLG
jgi:hypothetical protein